MKIIEIEGKTIDEAIEKACREFNVPREKLNIEIISEGVSGFLGIGARKALIKAGLINLDMTFDTPAEKPAPQPPKAAAAVAPPPKRPVQKTPAAVTPPPRKPAPHTEAQPSTVQQTVAAAPEKPDKPFESDEKIALRAKTILEGILTRMDLPCPITIEETEETITLNVEGDSSGLLIGKRGQNLDAIQYIVNKATIRSENGRKPIFIDTGAYRKRREESLLALASKLGDKVRKTKKAVTVSNMNAHDRRIIHLALQNDTSLVTKSRGEGEYRKIVIMPARKPRSAKNPS